MAYKSELITLLTSIGEPSIAVLVGSALIALWDGTDGLVCCTAIRY
jgi:hypothetical protein